MRSQAEVLARYARGYANATKKEKGHILDNVVAATGWSRDNARRRLTAATYTRPHEPRTAATPRSPRSAKFSSEARQVLRYVWSVSGSQCGKHLVVSMPLLLDLLEARGSLVLGQDRYSHRVRAQLLSMSAASIDRYLRDDKGQKTNTQGGIIQPIPTTPHLNLGNPGAHGG